MFNTWFELTCCWFAFCAESWIFYRIFCSYECETFLINFSSCISHIFCSTSYFSINFFFCNFAIFIYCSIDMVFLELTCFFYWCLFHFCFLIDICYFKFFSIYIVTRSGCTLSIKLYAQFFRFIICSFYFNKFVAVFIFFFCNNITFLVFLRCWVLIFINTCCFCTIFCYSFFSNYFPIFIKCLINVVFLEWSMFYISFIDISYFFSFARFVVATSNSTIFVVYRVFY